MVDYNRVEDFLFKYYKSEAPNAEEQGSVNLETIDWVLFKCIDNPYFVDMYIVFFGVLIGTNCVYNPGSAL